MHNVGFTNWHLRQRIDEHACSGSSIGKHTKLQHGVEKPSIGNKFSVLKKCRNKLNYLYNIWNVIRKRNRTITQRAVWLDPCEAILRWLGHLHNPLILECNPFQTHLVNNNFDISINDFSPENDAPKRRLTILLTFLAKCFNKQLITRSITISLLFPLTLMKA